MDDFTEASALFDEDIYDVLQPKTVVARRNSAGGTGFAQVEIAIQKAKEIVSKG